MSTCKLGPHGSIQMLPKDQLHSGFMYTEECKHGYYWRVCIAHSKLVVEKNKCGDLLHREEAVRHPFMGKGVTS